MRDYGWQLGDWQFGWKAVAVMAPVMVLFGQLLGLHSCLVHGLRPDAPSPDGVINRVVTGVEMHA